MKIEKKAPSALIAIQNLIDGNQRFQRGLRSVEHFPTPSRLKQLSIEGQKPFSVILSCADSRVPSELIFDQGLGDLFVLRVAGNVVAPSLLASLEFAVTRFGTPLVVVMGHSKCGAVQATLDHALHPAAIPTQNLEDLLSRIMPAVKTQLKRNPNHENLVDLCGIENVYSTAARIYEESPVVQKLVSTGALSIVPAFFCLDSGKVEFEPSLSRSN
jgi:carbonic anhydrase